MANKKRTKDYQEKYRKDTTIYKSAISDILKNDNVEIELKERVIYSDGKEGITIHIVC